MWNNPRLLNLVANVMFVLATLIIVQIAVTAAIGSPWFPLRKVNVSGDVSHLTREQIADAVNGRPLGNFFGADLERVRDWIEEVPWVRRAAVRRAWPDRLEVTIEEHRPLARWSDERLVNTRGELFAATHAGALPRLSGPPGTSAEVTERYYRFRELVKPLDNDVAMVVLSPRFAWQLRLADGLTIELGRDQGKQSLDERLARFVRAYPETLAKLARRLNYVDLRYPNGFALRVPDIEERERLREREDKVKRKA